MSSANLKRSWLTLAHLRPQGGSSRGMIRWTVRTWQNCWILNSEWIDHISLLATHRNDAIVLFPFTNQSIPENVHSESLIRCFDQTRFLIDRTHLTHIEETNTYTARTLLTCSAVSTVPSLRVTSRDSIEAAILCMCRCQARISIREYMFISVCGVASKMSDSLRIPLESYNKFEM